MGGSHRAKKRVVIIAGPNGAGKTTFAEEFLIHEAGCPAFINADLIARGIAPFAADQAAFAAGKIMLEQIASNLRAGRSFAFETTLSGLGYARQIPRWRAAGYHVKLIFLSLPSPDIAIGRVRARVAQGGHNIPEAVVRRRFGRGMENFRKVYQRLVDGWILYDSSGSHPVPMDEGGLP